MNHYLLTFSVKSSRDIDETRSDLEEIVQETIKDNALEYEVDLICFEEYMSVFR